jgi:hypothetical protein
MEGLAMSADESHYFLQHLLREHEGLSEELGIVRRSLRRELLGEKADSARQKAIHRLGGLRNHLAAHFEEEECEGCLEEAVSRRPSLAGEVKQIVAEHRGLIGDLDQMVEKLHLGASPREIASVEAEFEAFAERLIDHELRERAAVQAGLNIAE